MHQDQRIGLALGVLLIGACAALFFRNETRVFPSAPRLKNVRELDERIAERPTRPYMKGIEAIEIADQRRNRDFDDQDQSLRGHKSAQQQMYSWFPFTLLNRNRGNEIIVSNKKRSEKAPGQESDHQEFAPITVELDTQLANDDESKEKTESEISEPAADEVASTPNASNENWQTHVVQKGESLSSIAAKLLGDRSRYQEIFEANQDQLDDPNDVKLGMTLRIPHLRKGTPSYANRSRSITEKNAPPERVQPTAPERLINIVPPVVDINLNNSLSASTQAISTHVSPKGPVSASGNRQDESPQEFEVTAKPRRFVPVRQSPLPRQAGPQSNASDQRISGGRKLSQIALEPTSGKIAR